MKLSYAAPCLLLAACPTVFAQSSVQVYGLVDAAVRYTNNEGKPGGTLTQLIGGGLSQSNVTFRAIEDLGGGVRAAGLLEYRFALDNGSTAPGTTSPAAGAAGFWALSYVSLESASWGSVSLGRQYNVLFDVVTYTPYSSFRFGPYINAFKPEMAFAFGARQDNMAKYVYANGGLLAELSASPDEASALGGKSYGGMLRYRADAAAAGVGYMQIYDGADKKAEAWTVGASYTVGPWYFNLGWVRNAFDAGFNPALINSFLGGTSIYGRAATTDRRDLYNLGLSYQFSAYTLAVQYWHAEQVGRTAASNGDADFAAVVLDYALSKRTDIYAEMDHTRFHGGLSFPNNAQTRNGFMLGVRHRF